MKLARSTYYRRAQEPDPEAVRADAELRARMHGICVEFPRYGYRRVTAQLRAEGHVINHKKVARLMREESLQVRPRRRFVRTTDSDHDGPIFPDRAKDMAPSGPDRLWVADITYIRILNGFVYLAVIMDAWSRRVVGYAISRQMGAQLTLAALTAAIEARGPPPGCVHHSDRGSQYASGPYRNKLQHHGLKGSMGRRGNPYDNAKAESFMKTVKCEEVHLGGYETFQDVVATLHRPGLQPQTAALGARLPEPHAVREHQSPPGRLINDPPRPCPAPGGHSRSTTFGNPETGRIMAGNSRSFPLEEANRRPRGAASSR